jgi:hypothetical protein
LNYIIFGPQRNEVIGEWNKIHFEERNDLYFSPTIVWVNKSRKIKWAGHVARVGRGEAYTGFWWGNLRERDHLKTGLDGRKILRWIYRKWDVGAWTGSSWLMIGTGSRQL